jgi:hypothetical protein
MSIVHDDTKQQATSNPQLFLNIYISQLGRIFDFSQLVSLNQNSTYGEVMREGEHVFELDKSTPLQGCGSRAVWTFIDGHLTRITKMIEGFRAETLLIDPVHMTCQFSSTLHADPQTKRVVGIKAVTIDTTCTRNIFLGETVQSYKCTMRRGNVFSNDQ